jgi:hypothetical protein
MILAKVPQIGISPHIPDSDVQCDTWRLHDVWPVWISFSHSTRDHVEIVWK